MGPVEILCAAADPDSYIAIVGGAPGAKDVIEKQIPPVARNDNIQSCLCILQDSLNKRGEGGWFAAA